jgi:hypothetical protein
MKITRKQLRKLIAETMITPSTDIIRQVLNDPDVDERIKVILRGDTEEDIAQALSLLATIYPDRYGDIDIEIPAQTATTKYKEDFEFQQGLHKDSISYQLYVAQRDRLLKSFEPWLLQGAFSKSGRLLKIFEAALAHYFASADYMGLPNTEHEDYLLEDFPSFEVPSGRHPLYHMIAKEFMKTINIPGHPNLAGGSSVMSDVYGTSYHMLERLVRDGVLDLEAGIADAIESLLSTGDLYRDDNYVYLYVFEDPEGWLATNIPEYSAI